MPAFVGGAALFRRRIEREVTGKSSQSLTIRKLVPAIKRRRALVACAAPLHDDGSIAATQDGLYDDMRSDEDYVVLDGKDIAELVEELQRTGRDQIGMESEDGDEGLSEDFMTLAEKRSDQWNGRPSVKAGDRTANDTSGSDEEGNMGMEYFVEDHVQYMPRWAAEAYRSGQHQELEEASMRIESIASTRRLHDIVARKTAVVRGSTDVTVGGDGIVDCTVQDVADDYSVPVEFVVDALLHYGVPIPIRGDQSIRDSMTTEEIERLLNLITSFDAADLSDRYSDRTLTELADDYDLPVEKVLDVCQREALYVFCGEKTRLPVVREDRVLDIILKGGALGQPYPSLLEGLEK